MFPLGYHISRKDRTLGGGGVFIAAKEDMLFTERDDLNSDCETCWAEIQTVSEPLIIGTFYRPPGTPEETLHQLDTSLNKIQNNGNPKHILLGGDFNVPQINWATNSLNPAWVREHPHVRSDQNIVDTLLPLVDDHALTQTQTEPT